MFILNVYSQSKWIYFGLNQLAAKQKERKKKRMRFKKKQKDWESKR